MPRLRKRCILKRALYVSLLFFTATLLYNALSVALREPDPPAAKLLHRLLADFNRRILTEDRSSTFSLGQHNVDEMKRDVVESNTALLKEDASQLKGGASEFKEGVFRLREGASQIQEGASQLKEGDSGFKEGVSHLKEGASQHKEDASEFKEDVFHLKQGASQLKDLLKNTSIDFGSRRRATVTPGPMTLPQLDTVTFRLEDSQAFTFRQEFEPAGDLPQKTALNSNSLAASGQSSRPLQVPELLAATLQSQPPPDRVPTTVSKVPQPSPNKVPTTVPKIPQPPPDKVPTAVPKSLQPPPDKLPTTVPKVPQAPPDKVPNTVPKVPQAPPDKVPNTVPKVPQAPPDKVPNTVPKVPQAPPDKVPNTVPKVPQAPPDKVPTTVPKVPQAPPDKVPTTVPKVPQPRHDNVTLTNTFVPPMSKVLPPPPVPLRPALSTEPRSRAARHTQQVSVSPSDENGNRPLKVSVPQNTIRNRCAIIDEPITCDLKDSMAYDWSDMNLGATQDLCPKRPATTIGRFTPLMNAHHHHELVAMFVGLQDGGHYTPRMCTPIEKTAIIIPYRNRCRHLYTLLPNLIPMLMRQNVDFTIFVIEQSGKGTFNKGILFNAGYLEALKLDNYDCFILHDVDMIPVDDRNMYRCNTRGPTHFSSAVNKFKYRNLYDDLFGGVVGFTRDQFQGINGASNLYFGWGAEDDDLRNRVVNKNMTLWRRTPRYGVYDMVNHTAVSDVGWEPNPDRYKVYGSGRARQDIDGLNSLIYKLTWLRTTALYTWLGISFERKAILSTVPKKLRMGRQFNESYLSSKFNIIY